MLNNNVVNNNHVVNNNKAANNNNIANNNDAENNNYTANNNNSDLSAVGRRKRGRKGRKFRTSDEVVTSQNKQVTAQNFPSTHQIVTNHLFFLITINGLKN